MALATIQITQGATVGVAGQSVIGFDPSTTIVLTDAGGAGATSYLWEFVAVPGPYAAAPSILNSTTQIASIIPPSDLLDGVYLLRLTRTDVTDGVTTMVRFFTVGDEDGIALPVSGMNHNNSNVGGSLLAKAAGWFGSVMGGTNIFLDAFLRLRRKREGRYTGRSRVLNFSGSSPVTEALIYGTARPTQRVNATGTGEYTFELSTAGAEDGATFWFHVSHTTGAGNLVIKSGVAGTTITTLIAPGSGTTTTGLRFYYDGTAWRMWPSSNSEKRISDGGSSVTTDATTGIDATTAQNFNVSGLAGVLIATEGSLELQSVLASDTSSILMQPQVLAMTVDDGVQTSTIVLDATTGDVSVSSPSNIQCDAVDITMTCNAGAFHVAFVGGPELLVAASTATVVAVSCQSGQDLNLSDGDGSTIVALSSTGVVVGSGTGLPITLDADGGDSKLTVNVGRIEMQYDGGNAGFGFYKYPEVTTTTDTPTVIALHAPVTNLPGRYDIQVTARTASQAAVAIWTFTPLVVVRGGAVVLVSGDYLAAGPDEVDVALTGVTIDVTGGDPNNITVTGTGLAATTIFWAVSVRPVIP